jgi:hypothetical protein
MGSGDPRSALAGKGSDVFFGSRFRRYSSRLTGTFYPV